MPGSDLVLLVVHFRLVILETEIIVRHTFHAVCANAMARTKVSVHTLIELMTKSLKRTNVEVAKFATASYLTHHRASHSI